MPAMAFDVGIFVDSADQRFVAHAVHALIVLRENFLGNKLILAFSEAYRTRQNGVLIQPASRPTETSAIPTGDLSDSFRDRLTWTHLQAGVGTPLHTYGAGLAAPFWALTVRGARGCSGIALWYPSDQLQTSAGTIRRPSQISLAHEMIHCLHYATADCARLINPQAGVDTDNGLAEEEARTVGLGPYKWPNRSEKFCENAIRDAFKQPERKEYSPGNDLGHVTRT